MAFAISQTCCTDASCVSVCPVNCIHPTPDEPEFGTTEMLYIDPQTCIDCGACADACPVDAIFTVDQLRGSDSIYAELNEQYYEAHPADNAWGRPHFPQSVPGNVETLRIAVVGTGPAASYTAQALLLSTDAEVTMIDRLPVPGGLIRHGVAPDHRSTKKIGDSFAGLYRHPRLRMHMNIEVGTDITHAEVAAHHHAVIYAVGAPNDKTLGIPGEEMPGSLSATEFVAWYNSHPDVPATAVDLSAERAVIIGNGNVALDVARVLLTGADHLAETDIADHALAALRGSNVREVVLLARKGPEAAAYTRPELIALQHLPGVRVVVDDDPEVRDARASAGAGSKAALLRDLDIEDIDWSVPPPQGKRVVLRFLSAPAELLGDGRVEAVRISRNTVGERDGSHHVTTTSKGGTIPARLVLRSIGHRSIPVPDLPFDPPTATVPHDGGRVTAGVYVVGWIKRGPSGGIGTNKTCATETVDSLIEDAAGHRLPSPTGTARAFNRLVRRRKPDSIGRRQMLAIDRAERRRGRESGRPRVKFATVGELLDAGRKRRG